MVIVQKLQKQPMKWREGLTGKIAETGKPIISPQVSKEPLFLNRMSSFDPQNDREQSFIGVPIIFDYKTIGVLIGNLPFNSRRDYDGALKFLTLVASALVQPIRLQHVIQMERQRLLDENVMLKNRNFRMNIGFITLSETAMKCVMYMKK